MTKSICKLVWLGVFLLCIIGAPKSQAQDSDSTPEEATQVGTDVAEPDSDSPNPTDSDETDDASDANSDEPVAESAAETEGTDSTWMDTVDNWFGSYLVKPLGAWFFIDIGWPLGKETGIPFVVAWLLLGGIFLTIRMLLINVRAFWHAIRLTKGDYDDPEDEGDVSHFQALSAALSATVGLGNIGGVAIAIGIGGPGAAFWIFVIGFLGMSTKFAECTLGQIYRVKDDTGHTLGGPMRYLREGLKEKGLGPIGIALSVFFALLCIGASFGGGNAYQIRQSLSAIKTDFTILESQPWIYGLIMAIAVGLVIIGGIKSIGAVAGRIVPLMCFAYVASALWILLQNFAVIPSAFGLIVSSAFSGDAAYGGFIGVMVMGIQRAVFSNEAGVGSAAIAHSAAKTNEPVSEGIVALLEPFIDTMVVCTITALVLIVSGTYSAERFVNQHAPAHVLSSINGSSGQSDSSELEVKEAQARLDKMIKGKEGAGMTLVAFRSSGLHWFGYILFAAVVLFAFSTCICWSYYGERCWVELFGVESSIVYKILFVLFTFLGSIINATNILEFSDLMILAMSIPNLIGVFILSGVVKRALDDYWQRYKSGEIKATK